MWGVVAGRGGVGCVCGVGMPLWLCLVGAAAGVFLVPVLCAAACVRLLVYYDVLFACRLCPAPSRVAGLVRFVLLVGYCVVCVS